MATEVNVVVGVYAGEYGEPIILTMVDDDGAAIDISGYSSTKTIVLRSPDQLKKVTLTGSFTTDGTDGKVQGTPTTGQIDREGDWEGQVSLSTGSAVAKSWVFTMPVGEGIA